ncbi:MAG TPA: class F sortase [Pyrinomonadaceae bacterium]|nr:class F sortase [Pyrinomonadaceae bacterium]
MIRRFTAGIVSLIAAFVFGSTLAHALLVSPDSEVTATNNDSAPVTAIHSAAPDEYPVRLLIPSLGIDANVQYVGITAHGTMSVPNNFTDVGWYKYGPVPGSDGSAVMAGHVDNALALPGVFKNLQNIQPGADVYVREKSGAELHFVVDEVDTYDVADAPTSRIFETNGPPHLNLITCEGTWIQSEHQYDHRLVVYTHLES